MVVKERLGRLKESPSVRFAHMVKDTLTRSFDRELPMPPTHIGTLEDIIGAARERVSVRWNSDVATILSKEIAGWMPKLTNDPRASHCVEVLNNPRALETKISIRQFSDLDILRAVHPEAWYTLVRASMERQNAELAVLSRWSDRIAPSVFERLGTTKDGFYFAVELAQRTGPLVNETFMQQMMMADVSDDVVITAHTTALGAEHVYEVRRADGEIMLVPYIDMFPNTWPKLVKELRLMRDKIPALIEQKKVPSTYAALSVYLDVIAKTYESKETDFTKLNTLWNTLDEVTERYRRSGCPIGLCTQDYAYVSGPAAKVDAELGVSIETPKTKAYEYMMTPYQKIAERLADRYRGALAKPNEPVNVQFQELFFGTGSNCFWRTQGESTDTMIDVYVDSAEDIARQVALPLYERIFDKRLDMRAQDSFVRHYVESLAVHELAHTVLSSIDAAVSARIGSGVGLNAVEELKADSVGMKIFWEHIKNTWDMQHAKRMLENLVTYSVEYMLNRPSADGHGTSMYGDGGAAILSHLLNSGALQKLPTGAYEIQDTAKGFATVVGVAEYILTLYADPNTTPERIEQYAQYLKKHAENPKVKDLIAFAKA